MRATRDGSPDGEGEVGAQLRPGDCIGAKYEIRRLLGVGGSACVYAAEHLEIGRQVALKVVHRDLGARDDILQRFRREARVCGRIRDKNVAEVYDVGHLPDGSPYLVMELFDGPSLAGILDAQVLSLATVVDAGVQMLAGLSAAHRAGIVHRDLKPENLMLTRQSTGEVVVKLVDFGIAKPIPRNLVARGLTADGTVVGTPDYMAPEQLRGDELDERTDIYAAGAVLYELLTRKTPFDGESMTDLIASILRDPIVPLRDLRPDCPEALEALVMRALSRKRDERFATAAAMAMELRKVASEHRIEPREAVWAWPKAASLPPPEGPEPAEWLDAPVLGRASSVSRATSVSRTGTAAITHSVDVPVRRTPMVVALAVLLAAAGGGAAWYWAATGNDRAPAVAPAATSRVVEAAQTAPGSPEPAAPQSPAPVAPAAAPTAVAAAPPPLAEETGPAARRGHARTRSDRQPLARTPPATATPAATAPAEPRIAPPPPSGAPRQEQSVAREASSATDLVARANAAYLRGHVPQARALYREAIASDGRHAAAWRGLGMVSARLGQRAEALRAFRRYLELAPGAPDAVRIRERVAELGQGP